MTCSQSEDFRVYEIYVHFYSYEVGSLIAGHDGVDRGYWDKLRPCYSFASL